MCKVLLVSSSSYYYWLKHPVGLREQSSQALLLQIQRVYQKSRCRYGSPRITKELNHAGIRVSRPRVARVMKIANIKSIVRQKYRVQTTDSRHGYRVAHNHLQQNIHTERLAEKWVSDLTYIKTRMALPDCCNRFGWPQSGWLGFEWKHEGSRHNSGGIQNGYRQPTGNSPTFISFRPWCTIRLRRVYRWTEEMGHYSEYVKKGQLLG